VCAILTIFLQTFQTRAVDGIPVYCLVSGEIYTNFLYTIVY
jgi:hypothetical protein